MAVPMAVLGGFSRSQALGGETQILAFSGIVAEIGLFLHCFLLIKPILRLLQRSLLVI